MQCATNKETFSNIEINIQIIKRIIRIAVAVVIVAVFAGTFVYLYQKSKKTPTLYETENAEYANISRTTVLNGNIEPRDKVEIKPQINGIIAEIYKHAGDVVHTGDIIAKVKVIPGMEELNSADDRVRVARINFEQAKRDYDRAKKLYDDKLISTEEFEKAQQDLKKAKEESRTSADALQIVKRVFLHQTALTAQLSYVPLSTELFSTSR